LDLPPHTHPKRNNIFLKSGQNICHTLATLFRWPIFMLPPFVLAQFKLLTSGHSRILIQLFALLITYPFTRSI
jgi:hypothetical protein